MARSRKERAAVRRAYVTDRLPIREAAARAGVPFSTAVSWRRKAAVSGDDWDRAREAELLAAGGLGPITERVLSDFTSVFVSTMERLQNHPGDPIETAAAMARISESYAKTVRAAGRADPKLARLGVALETLKRLGQFLQTHHPELAPVFIETLEPFGRELSREWK